MIPHKMISQAKMVDAYTGRRGMRAGFDVSNFPRRNIAAKNTTHLGDPMTSDVYTPTLTPIC
jgi:hypothetical protein